MNRKKQIRLIEETFDVCMKTDDDAHPNELDTRSHGNYGDVCNKLKLALVVFVINIIKTIHVG